MWVWMLDVGIGYTCDIDCYRHKYIKWAKIFARQFNVSNIILTSKQYRIDIHCPLDTKVVPKGNVLWIFKDPQIDVLYIQFLNMRVVNFTLFIDIS